MLYILEFSKVNLLWTTKDSLWLVVQTSKLFVKRIILNQNGPRSPSWINTTTFRLLLLCVLVNITSKIYDKKTGINFTPIELHQQHTYDMPCLQSRFWQAKSWFVNIASAVGAWKASHSLFWYYISDAHVLSANQVMIHPRVQYPGAPAFRSAVQL